MTPEQKKERPVYNGVLKYFPDAILEVAYVSYIANQQHNPGTEMHWDKTKSIGTGDEIIRHLMSKDKFDTDGTRHLAKVVWRSLELLQRQLDKENVDSNNRKR